MRPKNLREALRKKLTKKELSFLKTSFDSIGDIAILEIPRELEKKEKVIADALLSIHHQFKVVTKRAGEHRGKYRIRKVRVITGDKRTSTIHKESGVLLKVDINKTYFSPRLSEERLRIAKQVKTGERVLVLFSGIAPYPLVIAKNSAPSEIVGVEINPWAHKLAKENLLLNKNLDRITLVRAEASKWLSSAKGKWDRIIMPLPHTSQKFLPKVLTLAGRNSFIHFYAFDEKGGFSSSRALVLSICRSTGKKCRILRVVKAGKQKPGHYRVCIDIKIL